MKTRYEYIHRPGYGRDDHLADEVIARAARHLGLDTGNYIAQCVGFAASSVPRGAAEVSLPVEPATRRKMERALRAARAEMPSYVDCLIGVRCVRRYRDERDGSMQLIEEERRGREWVTVATTRIADEEVRS